MKENDEVAIKVNHVYKNFTVYYDRANTLKERLLFLTRIKEKKKEKF